jgi:DNA polymerase
MNEIKRDILSCHLCDLSKSRSQSMSGYGDPNADLMIIDYSVSSYEDSTNSYYCGKSGEMLKDMVEKVLNSNTPSNSEWDSCKSYLFAQIESIKPKVIVTLGKDAYAKVTSENDNFQSVRGHVIDFKDYKLIPMYHPNHLLRNPDDKKIAFIDLKTIKSCI